MTIPGDSDDDWAELARELSRDKPQSLAEPPPPAEEMGLFSEVVQDARPAEEDIEELPETIDEGEGEGPPDGQPGTGRKRRRRRRRRRRGGSEQAAETAGGEAAEAEESESDEPADQGAAESGFSEEVEAELVTVDAETDEDAGEELLRDLIANWNVPSWDDVVAGLYRPDR
jgi:hypothetical protein